AVDAQTHMEKFPLRPTVMINSGGDFHCYWVLSHPIDLQRDSLAFRDLLRRTARALHGDLAAAEAARVLRVPGTLNFKYDRPVLVTVKSHLDLQYNLDDFEFLPQESQEHPSFKQNGNGNRSSILDRPSALARAEKYLAAVPPAIEGNNGDHHTYITCCKLVRD